MSEWLLGDVTDEPASNLQDVASTSPVSDELSPSPQTPASDHDPLDPLDPYFTGPNSWTGDDSGGYPGGPTPDGFRPREDGTGRFMYDAEGRLHMNPNYAEWLNHPDQEIDWGNVFIQLAGAAGVSVGLLPFNGAVVMGGWPASVFAEYLLDYRAIRTSP